jgi:hypothetical protein
MVMLTLGFWRRLTHREILIPAHVRRRELRAPRQADR